MARPRPIRAPRDIIRDWLRDEVIEKEGSQLDTDEAIRSCFKYNTACGGGPIYGRVFGNTMRSFGYPSKSDGFGYYFEGLRLRREDEKKEENPVLEDSSTPTDSSES